MSAYAVSSRGLAAHKVPQGVLATIMEMLYSNSEQGIAKLDFSDFTGMYQDRARTIPYTAVEQPLGSLQLPYSFPLYIPPILVLKSLSRLSPHLAPHTDLICTFLPALCEPSPFFHYLQCGIHPDHCLFTQVAVFVRDAIASWPAAILNLSLRRN